MLTLAVLETIVDSAMVAVYVRVCVCVWCAERKTGSGESERIK
jgi:hypothetical protein